MATERMSASRAALLRSIFLLLFVLLLTESVGDESGVGEQPSKPGGAGYALVFNDNIIIKKGLRDFPSTELTFEAWISTSDICHTGAILSYAKDSHALDSNKRSADFNHFVIFNPRNVLACHDYEYIDMNPDPYRQACHAQYNRTPEERNPITTNFFDRTGAWHHLAVTWSASDGITQIYKNGMPVAKSQSDHRDPLDPNGALVLGGEQDCFAGCLDARQGFYGMMDEVRIWKTVRSETDIINNMRKTGGDLINHRDLTAYWRFDDLDSIEFHRGGIAKDASGKGNDLDLLTPPQRVDVEISPNNVDKLETGALKFKNSYALNRNITGMPTKDITIEFWAKSPLTFNKTPDGFFNERYAEFFSYATSTLGDDDVDNDGGLADKAFVDDAIRIERYEVEYNRSSFLQNTRVSTQGAISVHINANRQGNGKHHDNWLDFATHWVDDGWHHIAVTWGYADGEVRLYFDGVSIVPFWRANEGKIEDQDPTRNGVDPRIGRQIERSSTGSLVLGQNQECFGGCFSQAVAYDGYMANVRVWDRVLDLPEIKRNMYINQPEDPDGLALGYVFTNDGITGSDEREIRVVNMQDIEGTDLGLGSTGPTYQYSYAPLTGDDGVPLPGPTPGFSGYGLKLHDKQVLMLENFEDFPSESITVEFWMWSIDTCREGVPFSYALGGYQKYDNAFLIFNYNDWGVSIMEDEGTIDDHNAGFGATDGRWHHIAVTWDNSHGKVLFYDNGHLQWRLKRAKGKAIGGGGTLVIGREQDCPGGCFDSASGAAGDVQPVMNREYGPQDFYGVIDEMRIWRRVRTGEEVRKGMIADTARGAGMAGTDISKNTYIDPNDPDLVAYWKFDEGIGYVVHDHTGHGHDLRMMEEPSWTVTRWLSTCGDGLREGIEQCDDGNRVSGDGCSEECRVESGWSCNPTSPSKCWQQGAIPSPPEPTGSQPTPAQPQSSPEPQPTLPPPSEPVANTPALSTQSSPTFPPPQAPTVTTTPEPVANTPAMSPPGSAANQFDSEQFTKQTGQSPLSSESAEPAPSKSKKSSIKGIFVFLIFLAVIVVVAAIAYRKREAIYDRFPQVERFVHSSQTRVNNLLGRRTDYDSMLSIDPEADIAPEFVDSQPPTAYQPPGRPGPYTPIPDAGKK